MPHMMNFKRANALITGRQIGGVLEVHEFLNFWQRSLDGALHSVTVAHARLIKPAEIYSIDGEFRLH
jgi:uncharacterized protein Usg